ncbi:MAG: hypothetical protein ACJ76H_08210 [Bacteriovoracaceae bacterium]
MKFTQKFSESLKSLKDKFPKSRGKGSTKTETSIFNKPRKEKVVRSGK